MEIPLKFSSPIFSFHMCSQVLWERMISAHGHLAKILEIKFTTSDKRMLFCWGQTLVDILCQWSRGTWFHKTPRWTEYERKNEDGRDGQIRVRDNVGRLEQQEKMAKKKKIEEHGCAIFLSVDHTHVDHAPFYSLRKTSARTTGCQKD